MSKVFVGTSGWSYDHWIGLFYPDGLAKKDALGFYAESLDTVEVNSTVHRIPYEKELLR